MTKIECSSKKEKKKIKIYGAATCPMLLEYDHRALKS